MYIFLHVCLHVYLHACLSKGFMPARVYVHRLCLHVHVGLHLSACDYLHFSLPAWHLKIPLDRCNSMNLAKAPASQ